MDKPELLAPAGNLDKLKTAFLYGADAVYIGGEEFSLRAAAGNFTAREMREGVKYAHDLDKKVYLTANIVPHNADIEEYAVFLTEALDADVDAVIVSDLGLFGMTRELAPHIDIHISTQAGCTNYKTAAMWHELGANRVILAREVSLAEIREIRAQTPASLEIEAFVHGAMCVSYSGRCLLSNYLTHRDANRGECAQPCRWKYFLMEEQRPNEYLPVFENERGTFIQNSKDLCMLEHVDKLIEAGVTSFKIEGRVKTDYYVAAVVKCYRAAIDAYCADPENYKFDAALLDEVKKVSHRDYTTGFFLEKPTGKAQRYANNSYLRDYDLIGIVLDFDAETNTAVITQRNRFFVGDSVEFLQPYGTFHEQIIEHMTDEAGLPIDVANKPQSIIRVKTDIPIAKGSMVRKKTTNFP